MSITDLGKTMKAETLRRYAQEFLGREKSLSQNELARRASIPTSTFSKFLSGKFAELTVDHEAKLLVIVRPEYSDVDVIAGKIKQVIVRRYPLAIANEAILRLAENIKKAS